MVMSMKCFKLIKTYFINGSITSVFETEVKDAIQDPEESCVLLDVTDDYIPQFAAQVIYFIFFNIEF